MPGNSVIGKLSSPYTFSNLASSLRLALIVAAFVLVYMLIAQIELIALRSIQFYLAVAASFSVVSFLLPSAVAVAVQLLPAQIKSAWQLWMEVCLLFIQFTVVALGNILLVSRLFGAQIDWLLVAGVWVITIVVGAVPLAITLFRQQKKELSERLALALQINESLRPVPKTAAVIYAESVGNYLHLHDEEGKEIRIRGTMKNWLGNGDAPANLTRVHSGFAISLPHVLSARGNAQGFFLKLAEPHPEIPVSRRYIPIVRKIMTTIPAS